MKRQEELQAAILVVGFVALSILVLLFILKCDEIVNYCRRKCCCCFRRDAAESVHSYSNLNELLFDTDDSRGGTLRVLRTSTDGDFVVVEKEAIAVDTFFSNVLSGNNSNITRVRESSTTTRRQDRAEAQEPLL